jgi:hypothetical protein
MAKEFLNIFADDGRQEQIEFNKTTDKHEVLLKRWDGECYIKVSRKEKDLNIKQVTGGLRLEVILNKKPASNVISLDIETEGLVFYYQPPLTKEEIDRGAKRPENVVGSYAVYHATKTGKYRNKEEAEKYKSGKAFHIYRPKAIDAIGKWVWCDLNITINPDGKTGVMTRTIPQDFLDQAVYPITIA